MTAHVDGEERVAADWEWRELVAHATLGTGRRPDVPDRRLAGITLPPGRGPEDRLLMAAAGAWAARRTALAPVAIATVDPRWVAPDGDPSPVAPSPALQLLDAVLSGVVSGQMRTVMLTRWLSVAAAAGWRIPTSHLTTVLDVVQRPLPGEAVAAIGRHGRWLAGLGQPLWADALVDLAGAEQRLVDAARPGAGSSRAQRAAAARLWLDAPERGRVLLHQRWAEWPRKVRVDVVSAAAPLVTQDDEVWLEAALADDAATVRWAAATALGRLPHSRRAARMADRLTSMVVATKRPLRQIALGFADIQPDPTDLADATGPPPDSGVIAWWRGQVMAAAPRVGWERVVAGVRSGSAGLAIAAFGPGSTAIPVLAAAAAGYGDAEWAERLRPALLAVHGAPTPPGGADHVQWERWLNGVHAALSITPGPWPAATTDDVLDWCASHPQPGLALGGLADVLLTRAGPELDDRLTRATPIGPHAGLVTGPLRTLLAARSLLRGIDQMHQPGATP